MSFLGVPIFLGLLALMIPGIPDCLRASDDPVGVVDGRGLRLDHPCLRSQATAVPLWMLAHMTVGGDGLHGRAIEGWGLLFNVEFSG